MLFGAEDLITLPWYNERVAALIPGAASEMIPRAGSPGLAGASRPRERQYRPLRCFRLTQIVAGSSAGAGCRPQQPRRPLALTVIGGYLA